MRVAITGGTGSLGGALIRRMSETWRWREPVEAIISVSRDEVKAEELAARCADVPALRVALGDVRDEARLRQAFHGCDVVVHAAALKRVTVGASNAEEMIKTNVQGTINVVRAATDAGVGRVLVVSSDKAVEPTNLYGVTKAAAEAYAVQSNSHARPRGTRVAVVRYGNVLGSRGSVVHVWREQLRRGAPLTVTSPDMTRFVITLEEAARFCLGAVEDMQGGEVFVPRLPAAWVLDLAEAVRREAGLLLSKYDFTGLRPGGEKLHESLISREEPPRTVLQGSRMVVVPSSHSWRGSFDVAGSGAVRAPYSSDAPDRWLGVEELAVMLKDVRPC